MSGSTLMLALVSILVFASVTLFVLGIARSANRRERIRRRYGTLPHPASGTRASAGPAAEPAGIDPARLGLDHDAQRRLQARLVQAGFLNPSAVASYALARLALVVGLPALGVVAIPVLGGTWGVSERIALALILVAIGYYLPPSYVSRRKRELVLTYRLVFPDFLDMLVVCLNAGLSLEAALDRAAKEIGESDAAFRTNLDLMAAEMRAGKGTPDALRALAERLALPEAVSFAGLLHQTIELGTDVAQALTTFSDEMRDRRMARAEETAAVLPPKLTIPLGLFIFPVVLITVLAPAVLKVIAVVTR